MTFRNSAIAAVVLSFVAGLAHAADMAATMSSGIDLAGFDKGVQPQDDFFRHVNGAWLRSTDIPADRSRWGMFDQLIDGAEQNVRAILESPTPQDDADGRKIRACYASYMDEARAEELGAKPLEAELARIAALESPSAIAAYMGAAASTGVSVPMASFISIDRRNSNAYAIYLFQGGLGLPDRDYYLRDDEKFVEIRAKYVDYLTRLLELGGIDKPADGATRVMVLEQRLAEAQWARVALRDPVATYNRMGLKQAAMVAPGLDWAALLESAGLPRGDFVVGQPSYATALGKLLEEVPVADWQTYLQVRLLNDYAPYLSSAFVEAEFDFNSKTLGGTPELRPRWKRAASEVNRGMGFAVGREYVARHFPPVAKQRMEELVENLRRAMNLGIDELAWMSPATRAEAHDKLRKVSVKIGYPEVWRDYSALEIQADDLVGNVRRATEFEWRRKLARLNKPVDRTEWLMTPQTVNAYYMPPANEIAFPAAILQPPFFNIEADAAVNYGAIGAVIGHEISHGFDDKGRQYDGDGNLRDWWTEEDNVAFNARAGRLVDQYDAYRPLPDQAINGELTLGENIGDLSGLAIAWKAWRMSLDGEEPAPIDGYSAKQRFFLGFGQIWRTKQREESLRELLLSDPHPPGEFRANGVVTNFEPFYEAFGLKEGNALWRPADERVKIW
jgi:putative endopeptidase